MSSRPAVVSSPAAASPPLRNPHSRRFFLTPTRVSRASCALARGGRSRYQPQPRFVAAQSPPLPLPAGAVPRDAETGLALLLFALAAVMSFFLLLTILSLSVCRALKKLQIAANKLSKIISEEVPGTVSALKLSLLEINDLTSQLTNLRKRLILSRFGRETNTKARA